MASERGFPSRDLVPNGGEIYAHIFENAHIGLARGLFWSITLTFEPVTYAGETFNCAMTCEWIPWAIRDWRALHGQHLDVNYGDDGVESSFYTGAHDLGTHTKLWITHREKNLFRVRMEMEVDFPGYVGGDEDPALPVAAEAEIPFEHLLISPDHFTPPPTSAIAVKAIAQDFVDLRHYAESIRRDHAYVLKPKF